MAKQSKKKYLKLAADLLQELLDEREATRTEFAEAIKVDRSSVASWCKGAQPIPKKHQQKVFDFLGLVDGEDYEELRMLMICSWIPEDDADWLRME